MLLRNRLLEAYLLCAPLLVVSQSNLPSATAGIFTAQASIEVNAPIEELWNILLDFPSYPNWNPFARAMIVTDKLGIPLADQTPHENSRLKIEVQVPPLPTPVSASTPPNILHSQTSFENITHIDHVHYRMAWQQIMIPSALLSAERWSALSIVGTAEGSRTLYESREVFDGPLAYTVQGLYGDGLQEGFDAQASALKTWAENNAI